MERHWARLALSRFPDECGAAGSRNLSDGGGRCVMELRSELERCTEGLMEADPISVRKNKKVTILLNQVTHITSVLYCSIHAVLCRSMPDAL